MAFSHKRAIKTLLIWLSVILVCSAVLVTFVFVFKLITGLLGSQGLLAFICLLFFLVLYRAAGS